MVQRVRTVVMTNWIDGKKRDIEEETGRKGEKEHSNVVTEVCSIAAAERKNTQEP
jgi:hypothetical protein